MIEALNSSVQGLLRAEERASKAAQEILEATTRPANVQIEEVENGAELKGGEAIVDIGADFGSLIESMVDLKTSEFAFKANAKAFEKIDETMGTLLDELG